MSDRYKGAILSPTAPTVTPQSAGGIYTSSQQLQYQGQGVWPQAVNYPINNSLRFRSSAGAYLNRTPASSTNRTTWTWSAWVKRGDLVFNSDNRLFGAGTSNSNRVFIGFENYIAFVITDGTGNLSVLSTTPVYRDPSAWYHLVVAFDSTQATASNRVKIYVNGTQVTAFSTATYPPQNTVTPINSTDPHVIGTRGYTLDSFYDGYMAEVNFVDGVALTPSSFGTTDAYGIWQPIPYTGSYGTNGFYLKFTDNSALTTSSNVGLGRDFSGNGNYWVTNGISITAGSTYDSMVDVPTNTNQNTANYCVMNPLDVQASVTLTDGNLSLSGGNNIRATLGNFGSGKYYYEGTKTNATSDPNYGHFGIASSTIAIGSMLNASVLYRSDGNVFVNDSVSTTYASYTTNDVIGVAINCDSSQVSFYKNNTLQGTISFPTGITASNVIPAARNNTGQTSAFNFGQRPFSYTPPTGFLPLNTYNLPTPTILQGDDYFNAVLWTGNGASGRSITGVGFAPDWTWIKDRTGTSSHFLLNTISGATKTLFTNNTSAELTESQGLSAFGSDGFTVGNDTGVNESPRTYVAWNWKANGAGVSNTNGTITSTVSANTTAGFSIVTYTGTGANATVGHGLGVAPSMVILKRRDAAAYNWMVWQSALTGLQFLNLDTTGAVGSNATIWNSTIPTSTVFSLGTNGNLNANGGTYVAYCFAAVSGYSSIGSFTGNGSTDGPFVYTGFRPKYILSKSTSASRFWFVTDTSRDPYNVCNLPLFPNDSQGETAGTTDFDILSNGFKARTTNAAVNGSGETIIYMAFAENPFKIARAR